MLSGGTYSSPADGSSSGKRGQRKMGFRSNRPMDAQAREVRAEREERSLTIGPVARAGGVNRAAAHDAILEQI